MIAVRFMTLTGEFRTAFEAKFPSFKEARAAVESYARRGGYGDVKVVDEDDGWRFTARTPGGRGGRNIAYAEQDYDPGSMAGAALAGFGAPPGTPPRDGIPGEARYWIFCLALDTPNPNEEGVRVGWTNHLRTATAFNRREYSCWVLDRRTGVKF